MPALQNRIMMSLYGHDIWIDYQPIQTSEMQGWHGDHPSLQRLVKLPGSKTVIDIGVWKGMSTINMARAMRDSEIDGCVIAVDTFLGSLEHWSGEGDRHMSRTNGHPDLFKIFLSNVCHENLQSYIVPMPQTSTTAALVFKNRNITASIVHIDAAHEYEEVFRDVREYWKILEPGGYLIGDDYSLDWPGVVRAAGEFSAAVLQPLQIEYPKWIIQKPW